MGVETIEGSKLAQYREMIGGIELDDHRKDEMISVVAAIMQAFVDNAFGISPTQLSLEKSRLAASFAEAARGMVQTGNKGQLSPHGVAVEGGPPEP